MSKKALPALVRTLLEKARSSTAGRASEKIHGGHECVLSQTVIALCADKSLAEHENPGEATLQVLEGRVMLRAGTDSWSGWRGDLMLIPPRRHSLDAVEDAVVLLTVAKRGSSGTGTDS